MFLGAGRFTGFAHFGDQVFNMTGFYVFHGQRAKFWSNPGLKLQLFNLYGVGGAVPHPVSRMVYFNAFLSGYVALNL
jgi:hypothetical protein